MLRVATSSYIPIIFSPRTFRKLCANFFEKRGGDFVKYVTVAKKPRKNISTIVAGKAITEPDVYEKVQACQKSSEDKKKA